MRITGNADTNSVTINKPISQSKPIVEKVVHQESETTISNLNAIPISEQVQQLNTESEKSTKVQEIVEKMNKMLEVHNNSSKFQYHEGLDRYYVTVVDRETEEVIKEIPPKKLLDAFYEMQKFFGMIVDKKI
ncbi:flagellar protein FlaG [Metasolibacillus sp.]|uniref:flagellar protein FlaG n=1 Tax=Metasolibacillus sp. TaxID=2703680 RepID=UPI0025E74AEE|nr:flagellar protein FlaG [Metasolibacillus sp.]MCT6925662.1 flagellar protein FlaG [Metasolibacillus sp.]MCT6940982.1 flagellar protein FlaG [Metasolibacillus sp.]